MKNKKLIILSLLLSIFLMACQDIEVSESIESQAISPQEDIIQTKRILNQADQIVLKKRPLSFSNIDYRVFVDRQHVANVKGKIFNVTGDQVELISKKGNLLGYEKQVKRWGLKFNRMAKIYDEAGNTSGYIGERVFKDAFKLRYSMHLFDKNKEEIGHTKKRIFTFFNNNDVYDNNNAKVYEIKQNISLFRKYTIEKESHQIDGIDMIYFTVIQDAINRSKNK